MNKPMFNFGMLGRGGKPRAMDDAEDDDREAMDDEEKDADDDDQAMDDAEDGDEADGDDQQVGGDGEDDDDDDGDDEASAAAFARGRAAERKRIGRILSDPAAGANMPLACEIAVNSNVTPAAAARMLKTAGASGGNQLAGAMGADPDLAAGGGAGDQKFSLKQRREAKEVKKRGKGK